MRNSKQCGSFFPCLFINVLMNIGGLLPAAVLLVLHFWLKISVWWPVGAFIAWVLYLIMWVSFIGWRADAARNAICRKQTKTRIPSGMRKGICDLPASAGKYIDHSYN